MTKIYYVQKENIVWKSVSILMSNGLVHSVIFKHTSTTPVIYILNNLNDRRSERMSIMHLYIFQCPCIFNHCVVLYNL